MKKLFYSFACAFRGLVYCARSERNMRIHLCVAAYMFGFLSFRDFFKVDSARLAALFIATALVISLEAVNTAIERATDVASAGKNPLAGAAKDAAAGAVLVAAIGAAATGFAIFWRPAAFLALFEYYKTHIPVFIALIASLAASLAFIFAGPSGIKKFFTGRGK